jgi:hypothetical protein
MTEYKYNNGDKFDIVANKTVQEYLQTPIFV